VGEMLGACVRPSEYSTLWAPISATDAGATAAAVVTNGGGDAGGDASGGAGGLAPGDRVTLRVGDERADWAGCPGSTLSFSAGYEQTVHRVSGGFFTTDPRACTRGTRTLWLRQPRPRAGSTTASTRRAGAGVAAAGAANRGTGAKVAATTTCAKPAGKLPRPGRERRGRSPLGRFGLGSACACGVFPWRRRGGWPRATGAGRTAYKTSWGKASTVERVDSDGDMCVLGKCWNPAMVECA